jgi:CspA family cold shock protein
MSQESSEATPENRRLAVVKWYSIAKGYGFAQAPGEDREIFLHHSQLEDGPPVDGEEVLLELGEGERGLFGARIKRPAARD